uniref:Uncharacterized protein n=1 Tax=Oryza punctata TaxID=4537 RepID=A0A0E0JP88_ORYPU
MSQCLSQDELLAPLLSTDPLLQVSSYSRVRTIYWLLALFLHSVNATLYLQKRLLLLENNFDCNGFFSECILPIVALIACTVYLVHLCWTSFPGKEVIFAGCTACIFYFSIAFTSLVYSNTTIAFEIVHILITIVVNILRFSSQDKIPECGWFCLTVAVAGTIIGFQWLPLRWCISVGDTKPKLHIAYKIAASVGGAFSFCDIVVGSHWVLLSQLLYHVHLYFKTSLQLHLLLVFDAEFTNGDTLVLLFMILGNVS